MSETLKNVAAFSGSACGSSDPSSSACGSADPKKVPESACGSACGSADPDKK